jgi:fermentation-respiration switch protein FrsA (DUF1100 family)
MVLPERQRPGKRDNMKSKLNIDFYLNVCSSRLFPCRYLGILFALFMGCSSDTTPQTAAPTDHPDTIITRGTDLHNDTSSDLHDIHPSDLIVTDTSQDVLISDNNRTDTSSEQLLAPHQDPVQLPIYDWLTANPTTGDTLFPQMETGSFVMPAGPGTDSAGMTWSLHVMDDEGSLPAATSGLIYGAAEFYTGESIGLIVRADTVLQVYVNGAMQPGDVYATGDFRVPFRTISGNNTVLVRGFPGDNPPQISFETTTDELYFNMEEIILPNPREGEMETLYIGVQVLNLSDRAATELSAQVIESDLWHATEILYPSLGPGTAANVAFRLDPRAPIEEGNVMLPVTLGLQSASLNWRYEREIEVETYFPERTYRRSFHSEIDGSAQYYGVVPPKDFDADADYGLVLSLHGASVEAYNLARSYEGKDWAYIVTPTNRRPFGFDWEAWGRLDALEVLDHALDSFNIDPTRVFVTGHSMGGHGTWQLGTLFPGRFAVVGPSAGWISFETYVGTTPYPGAVGRAQASSDTLTYINNLQNRSVYIIHGGWDDSVPVTESQTMYNLLQDVTDDLDYHEEPEAIHWWDGPVSEGVDCVDWPLLFNDMETTSYNPYELSFYFITPSPMVSDTHSYVTIHNVEDPYQDAWVSSQVFGDLVILTTANISSLEIDTQPLLDQDVAEFEVDGTNYPIDGSTIQIGVEEEKRQGLQGPLYQVWHRPFCFVYSDLSGDFYKQYAAFLTSNWALRGNGHGCALPLTELTADIRENYNLVYLGVTSVQMAERDFLSAEISAETITLGDSSYSDAATAMVFSDGDQLNAVISATVGSEWLLYRLPSNIGFTWQPFTSGYALPDYIVWSVTGQETAGFFDGNWDYDPALEE